MIPPARFSPVLRLPNLYGGNPAVTGIVPVACVIIIGLVYFWLPDAWTAGWDWYHYVFLFAGGSIPIYFVGRFAWKLIKLGVRARMREWLARAPRSPAEHAAAAFYLESREPGRSVRAAITARYLESVSPDQGRLIVVGELPLQPNDDGTLNEEADVFEGRARKVPRWVYGLLAFVFCMQLFMALTTGGLNPLYWRGVTWMIMIPAAINATFVLLGWGVIRLPGSVALASPRLVLRSAFRGAKTFTTDDSLLVVSKMNRMVMCVFYRRDGEWSSLTYPSADTKGLTALINRWCLLPAAPSDSTGSLNLSEQPPAAAVAGGSAATERDG